MKRELTFTVVIPFYRGAYCLEKIIIALLNQTKLPDEIIIIDDTSPEIITTILDKYPVTYFRQSQNRGVAAARNKGLELSKSDVTIFIDADAIPETSMIESISKMYELFRNQIVGVGGRAIECRIQSNFDSWRAYHVSQDFGYREKFNVLFLFGVCCSYKTDILRKEGGFDPFFSQNAGEDFDLGIRLRNKGYRLAYSPDIVVNHQHKDTCETLYRSQYLWSYWGYLANNKNGRSIITPWLGHLYRLLKFIFLDLVIYRDINLALLSLLVFRRKFLGLYDASKQSINK